MALFASLKFRIAATIFVLEGLMMGFTLWQVLGALHDSIGQQAEAQEQVTLDLLKARSLQALVTEEFADYQPLLEGLQRDRRIVRALLANGNGRIVAASQAGDLGQHLSDLNPAQGTYWKQGEIGDADAKLGALVVEFSRAPLEAASAQARNLGVAVAITCMLLIAVVGVMTGWLLTRRLDRLRVAAQKVTEGDLSVRTSLSGQDEVAKLSHSFDQMTARIAHDQEKLKRANAELEQRVEARTSELTQSVGELQRTQKQLVQSEKLAALGSIVAGVAHEINTPIGVGVTCASYMDENIRRLRQKFEEGTLERADFSEFLDGAAESSAMVQTNLKRASELIKNFKMVAVDQTSEKRRRFDLRQTVGEIVSTLLFQTKGGGVTVDVNVPEGISMDSFPGPLAQVMTNLVANAMTHAFDGRGQGRISVMAEPLPDERVQLRFADDGVGIAPDHLHRIFEPFFTTKFGHGGSGLGLHIVHNIVTGVLGGEVRVDSQVGSGTTFTMDLPLVAPAHDRAA